MNMLKTGFLMMAMTAVFVFAGAALGGQTGIVIALGFALVTNFVAYWYSDKMVLAAYRGQEISRTQAPRLYEMVERLAKKADLPMPKVYLIPTHQPNAFATGRNPEHAAVAVTEGLMRLLNERELAAVIAHELGHVKHRDILIGTVVGTMAGAISSLAWMAKWGALLGGFGGRDGDGENPITLLILAIVTPIIAILVQMAVSRSREYHADQFAGELVGDPMALAAALEKIHRGVEAVPMDAGPATAHMFIANPLSGAGRSLMNAFSTHPSMEDRIARLSEQAAKMGPAHRY
jgi:heat shock protein HtpX